MNVDVVVGSREKREVEHVARGHRDVRWLLRWATGQDVDEMGESTLGRWAHERETRGALDGMCDVGACETK